MKKIIIISSIIIIIIGGYFIYWGISKGRSSPENLIEVARGIVIDNVSVTGTVISAKQIDLEFENQGKIAKIETAVGEQVENSQVLVRLNTAELNAQLQSNRAALEMAQAKLAQILAGTREEDIQIYRAAVTKAEVEVENKKQALLDAQTDATNDLNEAYEDALDATKSAYTAGDQALIIFAGVRQKHFNGSSQLAIAVQDKEIIAENNLSSAEDYLDITEINPTHDNVNLALDKMKTALNSIRDALAYLRSALDDPTVSEDVSASDETNVDTERSNIDNERTNLTSAEQTISSTEITNQTNINTAQSNLEAAQAALEKTQNELASQEAGPRQSDIDLAQAEVKQAQANVLQAQEKINKSILKAPVAGLITEINKEEGEVVQANTIVVSMISVGHFQVEANVSETEIAKVTLGDKIEMTLDALGADEVFSGQIIKIDPAETVISGVIYYKITSVFDVEDERIKSGMTVNLDIQVDKRENVLYLPFYAIKEKDKQKYVLVLEGKEKKEKVVQTGLEGENNVEIIEGLIEGEQVIVER